MKNSASSSASTSKRKTKRKNTRRGKQKQHPKETIEDSCLVTRKKIAQQGGKSDHLQWQRVPWHISPCSLESWKHKQVSLKCYPGFSKSGEHGNPLVIDSSSDDEEVACKLIPGQSGDSSNSSSSSSDKDIPLAQLIHISSDEESPGPCTKEQTKVKPGNSSNSSSSSRDEDIPQAQHIHISSDQESPGPRTKEQPKFKHAFPKEPSQTQQKTPPPAIQQKIDAASNQFKTPPPKPLMPP
ncbi:hypothetical protein PCASD_25491 [Puccinia coronata f. sp. avenae]|uniref:Uncharacterized protein n=1 Tax=Puccinia coronata f. sp. avenae TaxID=200324 RepID=A0A2N5RV26_9BASI|nr:hypothetical protein PCASD_25491 [Puccinia coronata f. sp. avenae]